MKELLYYVVGLALALALLPLGFYAVPILLAYGVVAGMKLGLIDWAEFAENMQSGLPF